MVKLYSRNPLKSGQCFLLSGLEPDETVMVLAEVAIPSNRVNVSYDSYSGYKKRGIDWSQSPQIGSMFLT